MNVFHSERTVVAEDLDELQHVNNVRYVEWIQEISKAHWEGVVPQRLRKDMIWVVRRHDIRYKVAAYLGEELLLKTYIAKSEGFISTRVVEVRHKISERLLLKSFTDWCLLSKDNGKPMTISAEIHTLFQTPSP